MCFSGASDLTRWTERSLQLNKSYIRGVVLALIYPGASPSTSRAGNLDTQLISVCSVQ